MHEEAVVHDQRSRTTEKWMIGCGQGLAGYSGSWVKLNGGV